MSVGNRKAKRRGIHISFTYWGADNEKRAGEGIQTATHDISANGLSFTLESPPVIGTKYFVNIFLPNRKLPIQTDIKVVRVESQVSGGGFLVGVIFGDMSMEEKIAIDAAVNKINLNMLLKSVIDGGASDLHLTVGRVPMVRRNGRIMPMAAEKVEEGEIEAMLYPLLTNEQISIFEERRELDFSFSPDISIRFRVNMHWQKGLIEATMRLVPSDVQTFESLNLPAPVMSKLCDLSSGLVLISGGIGTGKTTTLGAMVEHINREQAKVVIMLEDPIEYVFKSNKSIIKQRELGSDTESYAEALKRSLRQDPDIICISEIREVDCLIAALKAAETGYLVIATAHATSATGALERLVGMVPGDQKDLVCQLLANALQGVLYQKLLPKVGGGEIPATEVLLSNNAIKNLIRTSKFGQMPNTILAGRSIGMHTFQMSLEFLHEQGLVSEETLKLNLDDSYT